MRFVFWQNIVSPHQEAHLTALARLGHEVVLVAENESMPSRTRMGWVVPQMNGVGIVLSPSEPRILQLLRSDCETSVHIFSGTRGFPMVESAFDLSKSLPVRRGLLVENRPQRGPKSSLRRALYRLNGLRNRKLVDFVLVIGYGGRYGGKRLYTQSGYRPEKLFPYGYFVEAADQTAQCSPNALYRIAFVGQLEIRKRCDLLLTALSGMKDLQWRLEVIGDGPEFARLARQIDSAGLGDRVACHGYLPAERIACLLATMDLLVLPSDHDGWGVVVNEALMQGTPVVCSDRCGAGDLLDDPWRGEVFRRGSLKALTSTLTNWLSMGPATSEQRLRIRDWSTCISGDSAARYLLSVVRHTLESGPRPIPPWMSSRGLP